VSVFWGHSVGPYLNKNVVPFLPLFPDTSALGEQIPGVHSQTRIKTERVFTECKPVLKLLLSCERQITPVHPK